MEHYQLTQFAKNVINHVRLAQALWITAKDVQITGLIITEIV